MYEVRIIDAAKQELSKLDKVIARRVVKRVHWLAEHMEDLRREALTGDWSNLFKLRIGDYCVLYEVLEDERLIIIHKVGHRRDIYKRR